MGGSAVGCVEGVKKRAQDTGLRRADAEGAGGREVGSKFHSLGPVGQEVPDLGAGGREGSPARATCGPECPGLLY